MSRFALGRGRKRPPYTPKSIKCAACGAMLQLMDEGANLLVCRYCGANLGLSQGELSVLGVGQKSFGFPVALGERFRYKAHQYEVCARIAVCDAEEPECITREYYLYNPRCGTWWLAEYEGQWDISRTSRVIPVSNPLARMAGQTIETFDRKKWVCTERGRSRVVYVDGALPWIAQAGDLSEYAEFRGVGGGAQLILFAEKAGSELEISTGTRLDAGAVERGFAKMSAKAAGSLTDNPSVSAKRVLWRAVALAVAALAINVSAAVWVAGRGVEVLREGFTPGALTAGAVSRQFDVGVDGSLIKIDLRSPSLANAWMVYDVALLGPDQPVWTGEGGLEYFSGVEGGESWSEGSSEDTIYLKVPNAGTYRLSVKAASGTGEGEPSRAAADSMELTVTDGASIPKFFTWMWEAAGVFLIICLIAAMKLKKDD
ncbi:MAG: DUF4178 domain-containing protein [Myxococcota bacterium]